MTTPKKIDVPKLASAFESASAAVRIESARSHKILTQVASKALQSAPKPPAKTK